MQSDTAYALLIGISEYRYMGRLPKAVVDVKDLHEVLLQSGYISSNVQKLLNNDATKSNIDDKLGWLARSVRSRADSTVLIYFSAVCQVVCKSSEAGCACDAGGIVSLLNLRLRMTA